MRRDGLCLNFLMDQDEMSLLADSFPHSIINVGYPAICAEERKACERILSALQDKPVEGAVVGHAQISHFKIMSELVNKTLNTSANFWIPFSDYLIARTIRKNPKELLENTKELVRYWKSQSNRPLDIAIVDVTAKEHQLRERLNIFYNELMPLGIRNFIICDSKGHVDKKSLVHLVYDLNKMDNLEFHSHNDNGQAQENIRILVSLGIIGIGTGVFGHGERGTMIDPRLLIAEYGLGYNSAAFEKFESKYNHLIKSLNENEKIFKKDMVVTGTQHRLWGRDPTIQTVFGVTSDKYILAKNLNIKREEIQEDFFEFLKNGLYTERKRVYNLMDLRKKWGQFYDKK